MTVIETALPRIMQWEAFRACPYRCPAGVWTIGYGTTRYPSGVKVGPDDPPVTRQQAEEFLRTDAAGRWAKIHSQLTRPATPAQGAAMLSLAYNIGVAAFLGSTLLRKFNAGDLPGAADEFLRWNRSGSKVLPGLVKRRAAERALFLENKE